MEDKPKTIDWIRFLTQVRSNFVASDRSLRNSELFADSCYKFYTRSWKSAGKFGLVNLFLSTKSGGVRRIFSLTEQDGHLYTDKRNIPKSNGLEVTESRAHTVYGLVDPAGEKRRVQIFAHHVILDAESKRAMEGFCNYLVQEFVLQGKGQLLPINREWV
jgi:hypothetical protein